MGTLQKTAVEVGIKAYEGDEFGYREGEDTDLMILSKRQRFRAQTARQSICHATELLKALFDEATVTNKGASRAALTM